MIWSTELGHRSGVRDFGMAKCVCVGTLGGGVLCGGTVWEMEGLELQHGKWIWNYLH